MIQRLSPRPLDGSLSRRCQVAGRSPACCAPAARTTSKYFGRKSNHSPVVEWLSCVVLQPAGPQAAAAGAGAV
eukprot:1194550-Prorocentrum_minimum.AAC.1